jgi:hypothetical protein
MSADECESAFKYARRDANAKLARADTLGVLAIVLGRLSTLRNQLSVDYLLSTICSRATWCCVSSRTCSGDSAARTSDPGSSVTSGATPTARAATSRIYQF